ncbi:MAG: ferredoxin family protein [Thermodesulfobacteriota bacterium]
MVRLYKDRCNGCGVCIFECGRYVYDFDADKYIVNPRRNKDCINCFACQYACPTGAIEIRIPLRPQV